MMNRNIVYEAWHDEDYVINRRKEIDEENEEEDLPRMRFPDMPIQIRTPLGMFSSADPMLPSKLFSCWICHTNFDIGEEEYQTLMTTPGIEIIRIMSRYRFFMGIGKLFSFRNVRRILDKKLCGIISREETQNKAIFDQMSKASGKWAVFLADDGKVEQINEADEEFPVKLQEFESRKDGRILTWENANYYRESTQN